MPLTKRREIALHIQRSHSIRDDGSDDPFGRVLVLVIAGESVSKYDPYAPAGATRREGGPSVKVSSSTHTRLSLSGTRRLGPRNTAGYHGKVRLEYATEPTVIAERHDYLFSNDPVTGPESTQRSRTRVNRRPGSFREKGGNSVRFERSQAASCWGCGAHDVLNPRGAFHRQAAPSATLLNVAGGRCRFTTARRRKGRAARTKDTPRLCPPRTIFVGDYAGASVPRSTGNVRASLSILRETVGTPTTA